MLHFRIADALLNFTAMTENIPIEKMTTKEKVQLMERLWKELSQPGTGYEPPAWHGDELSKREQSLSDQKEVFTDWNRAKEEIRKHTS